MTIQKRHAFICLIALLAVMPLAGVLADTPPELSIRLYDQKIYFPGDSVQIRVTIRNTTADTYRFRLAEEHFYNLDFDVRSASGQQLAAPAEHSIRARTGNQHVFYRDVVLLPGEEFSFIEDLSMYRDFAQGIYVVQARFYPELMGTDGQIGLISNTLTLSIREGYPGSELAARVENAMQEEMQMAELPPDEVISFMLEGRMHSRRTEFFQYLDVERLYTAQQQRATNYARLSAQNRRSALENYSDQLWANQTLEGISLIPLSYDIQKTSYNPNTGTVSVIQRYSMGEYIEIKSFTYYLERRDGIWYITDYQVTNLGTE